jgi:hypothetical protein
MPIKEVIQLKYRTIDDGSLRETNMRYMRYTVVSVLITVLVTAIAAVTGGCGESTEETTIEFSRILDTDTSYDSALTRDTIQIIRAYGSSDDFDRQHISRVPGEIIL